MQACDGTADSLTAIADFGSAGRSREDRLADRRGVLAARIIVGDDHVLCLLYSDGAHQWALALITVTASAEHDDKPALHVRTQRIERLRERVRLVRIVDEHRRAAAMSDKLEPALRALQALRAR